MDGEPTGGPVTISRGKRPHHLPPQRLYQHSPVERVLVYKRCENEVIFKSGQQRERVSLTQGKPMGWHETLPTCPNTSQKSSKKAFKHFWSVERTYSHLQKCLNTIGKQRSSCGSHSGRVLLRSFLPGCRTRAGFSRGALKLKTGGRWSSSSTTLTAPIDAHTCPRQLLWPVPDKDKYASRLVHWGLSVTPRMNGPNKSHRSKWE